GTQGDGSSGLDAREDLALQQKTREGVSGAIGYLEHAVKHGSTNASDFQQLGNLLTVSGRNSEAVSVFQKAITLVPYDPEAYRNLARTYMFLQKKLEACEVLGKAGQLFPLDAGIRTVSKDCESAKPQTSAQ